MTLLAGCGRAPVDAASEPEAPAPAARSGSDAPPPTSGAAAPAPTAGASHDDGTSSAGQPAQPSAGAAAPAAGSSAPTAGAPAPSDAGIDPQEPAVTRDTGLLDAPCLADITSYAETGPFDFEALQLEATNPTTGALGQVKVLLPDVPEDCRIPVVHFANGTGATCESYAGVREHLASHGFLTTCYENTNTGDGMQCLAALEVVLDRFQDRTSRRVGSLGQSTGGQGALYCVHHARAAWGTNSTLFALYTMAAESGFGAGGDLSWMDVYAATTSPVLTINGSDDALVSESWVGRGFDALSDQAEAYWYEAVGAPHIPIPVRWMNESAVAWLRWQLLGDAKACEHFKAMPDSDDWNLKAAQNASGC